MPTYCCVPLCKGKGGHKFPKDSHLRQQWIAAIKRANWQPTATSIVCESHFKAEDYKDLTIYGYKSLKKVLIASAVPSQFALTPQPSVQDLFGTIQLKTRCKNNNNKSLEVPGDETSTGAFIFEINGRSILKSVLLNSRNRYVTCSTVSREQPFQCELCCESFANLDDLTIHGLVHARDKPHKCQECLTSFSSSFDLHFHEKIHAAETHHRCESDSKPLAKSKPLKKNEKTKSSKNKYQYILPAIECTEQKKYQNILPAKDCTEQKKYRYILPAIGRSKQRPNACEPCAKVMTDTDSLNKERKTEKCPESQMKQKPMKCLFCNRSFDRVVRIHVGQKSYSCHLCGEAFAQKNLLNAHMATHTLIPYSADELRESSSQGAANITKREMVKNKVSVNCTIRKRAVDAAADHTYAKKSKEKRRKTTFWSIQNSNIDSLLRIILAIRPEKSLKEDECSRKESTACTCDRPVAAPYGCGVCDEMFEIEKEFFEHCSNHFDTSFEDPLF